MSYDPALVDDFQKGFAQILFLIFLVNPPFGLVNSKRVSGGGGESGF